MNGYVRIFIDKDDFKRIEKIGQTYYAQWGKKDEGDNIVSCYRTGVSLKNEPSLNDCIDAVSSIINDSIDKEILSGYKWKDSSGTEHSVWLSIENQFNYKAAYDIAVQTSGSTLPVSFKLGDNSNPDIVSFTNMQDLSSFVTGTMSHVQKTLEDGWKQKDEIRKEFE